MAPDIFRRSFGLIFLIFQIFFDFSYSFRHCPGLLNTKYAKNIRFNVLKVDEQHNGNIDISSLDENAIQNVASTMNAEFMDSLNARRSYLSILTERTFQNIDDFEVGKRIKKFSKMKEKDIKSSGFKSIFNNNNSNNKKERIVILGTGWGSYSFLKTIDTTIFDVTVISPKNYFLFTPMLAASAVGTVELKSIIDPIRNVNALADYLEASATAINVVSKTINCVSLKCEGTTCDFLEFEVNYDYLICAVGAMTNTYGIKGVKENCLFLKQLEDAANIRQAIVQCFERSNVPDSAITEADRYNMLSFVVVGAGPTGVEFTSELRDWVEVEGKKYYPGLLQYVRITLVEAGNCVLPVFDDALRDEALKCLIERKTSLISEGYIDKEMTTVKLKAGVKEIGDQKIFLSTGETIPYGFCVWAAGNGPLPFVTEFIDNLDDQKAVQNQGRGRLVTDRWLKVLGTRDVFALGDCSTVKDFPLPATAQVASQEGAYLGRLFSKNYDMKQPHLSPPSKSVDTARSVDNSDQKVYMSEKLKVGSLGVKESSVAGVEIEIAKPFQFLNLGVLAYVGASKALAQVSVGHGDGDNLLGSGSLGFLLWRGIYWFKQVSWRNRMLVAIDWFKARLFGRDIGSF